MTKLAWDKTGEHYYETGLDHGVLYLEDGTAVPWNGLVAVDEDAEESWEPVYFEGVKIRDRRNISEFSATLRAITYPDEFLVYAGEIAVGNGFYATDQNPRRFSLCYRTLIGTEEDSDYGYRLHILFNLTAVPDTKGYVTIADVDQPVDFVWKITAIPTDILKYRPTAHVVIEPRTIEPTFLAAIEELLFGSDTVDANLPTLQEFYNWASDWWYLKNTDNGDGSITIESDVKDGVIVWLDDEHTMANVVGIYVYNVTAETYDIGTQTTVGYEYAVEPEIIIG